MMLTRESIEARSETEPMIDQKQHRPDGCERAPFGDRVAMRLGIAATEAPEERSWRTVLQNPSEGQAVWSLNPLPFDQTGDTVSFL